MSLGYALRQRSVQRTQPFPHWEIDRPLTADARQEVVEAFAPEPPWDDSSPSLLPTTSETQSQLSIDRDNVSQFPALAGMIDDLLSRKTIERIESMTGRLMDGAFLNVEVLREGRGSETSSPSGTVPLMTVLIAVATHRAAEHGNPAKTNRRDNVGWMFLPSVEVDETPASQLLDVDSRLLVVKYIMQATDWKLPPRRNVRVA